VIECRQRVIYGDTDQMGVVYYANYFRYFEAARGEYFRVRGASYLDVEKAGYFFPVIEAQANYRASARYDDLLIIKAWIEGSRRASVTFKYEVRREGSDTLLIEGHTIHACINKEGRPCAMPQSLRDLIGADAVKPPQKQET
jgi:acyl-CoA thioester hydrolase